MVAVLAAEQGDVTFLEEAIAEAKRALLNCPETLNDLCVLRWEALARAGEENLAITEIADLDILAGEDLTLICGAARLLNTVDLPLEAVELINRAKFLIKTDSSESDANSGSNWTRIPRQTGH